MSLAKSGWSLESVKTPCRDTFSSSFLGKRLALLYVHFSRYFQSIIYGFLFVHKELRSLEFPGHGPKKLLLPSCSIKLENVCAKKVNYFSLFAMKITIPKHPFALHFSSATKGPADIRSVILVNRWVSWLGQGRRSDWMVRLDLDVLTNSEASRDHYVWDCSISRAVGSLAILPKITAARATFPAIREEFGEEQCLFHLDGTLAWMTVYVYGVTLHTVPYVYRFSFTFLFRVKTFSGIFF